MFCFVEKVIDEEKMEPEKVKKMKEKKKARQKYKSKIKRKKHNVVSRKEEKINKEVEKFVFFFGKPVLCKLLSFYVEIFQWQGKKRGKWYICSRNTAKHVFFPITCLSFFFSPGSTPKKLITSIFIWVRKNANSGWFWQNERYESSLLFICLVTFEIKEKERKRLQKVKDAERKFEGKPKAALDRFA